MFNKMKLTSRLAFLNVKVAFFTLALVVVGYSMVTHMSNSMSEMYSRGVVGSKLLSDYVFLIIMVVLVQVAPLLLDVLSPNAFNSLPLFSKRSLRRFFPRACHIYRGAPYGQDAEACRHGRQ